MRASACSSRAWPTRSRSSCRTTATRPAPTTASPRSRCSRRWASNTGRSTSSSCAQRLTAGGVAGLQVITIQDRFFETYRREMDFIRRYIFPGGMLPSPGIMQALGEQGRAGAARRAHLRPRLCRHARGVARALPRRLAATSSPLGFDERFRRMWEYYLSYCEAGFRSGNIDVRQIVYSPSPRDRRDPRPGGPRRGAIAPRALLAYGLAGAAARDPHPALLRARARLLRAEPGAPHRGRRPGAARRAAASSGQRPAGRRSRRPVAAALRPAAALVRRRRAPLVVVGAWQVFVPPAGRRAVPSRAVGLRCCPSPGRRPQIPYAAWGAELSRSYAGRNRVTAFREAFTVVGTLLALSRRRCCRAFGIAGRTGGAASLRRRASPSAAARGAAVARHGRAGARRALAHPPRLAARAGAHMAANAPVPAAASRPSSSTASPTACRRRCSCSSCSTACGARAAGPLLVLYFVCGIAGVPFWLWLARRTSKHRAWCAGHDAGLRGLRLRAVPRARATSAPSPRSSSSPASRSGADVVLPASIQADVIDVDTADIGRGARRALSLDLGARHEARPGRRGGHRLPDARRRRVSIPAPGS